MKKKTASRPKKKTPKKSTKAAIVAPKKKAKPVFFTTGKRGARGVDRRPLHVLITPAERQKLIKLTHAMKLNAADVVRTLINKAKL